MQDNILGNELGSKLEVTRTNWNILDDRTKTKADLDPSPKHITHI